MEAEGREPVSLAEKLDRLFSVRSRERGRSLSVNEVATALNIKAGKAVISGNYIWHLRKGKRDNPTKRHLEALAEYFDVPAAYFHDRQEAPSSTDATAQQAQQRETAGEKDGPAEHRLALAEKLDHLLRLRTRPSEGGTPPHEELAGKITAQSGEPFSGAYLSQLHSGECANPTLRHLSALAAYFEVPVAYFTDDEVARRVMDDDLLASQDLDRSMAEAGVSAVYLRGDLAALSPEGKRMAADMIRQIRELERGAQQPPSPPQT
ncbi:hypothetical protein ACWCO0_20325 [Streptomyces tubercidicus]|uniref:HTH cro/C1-type domain-containing protein n=1 Tax=Streptomyces tubercidicus TaxID=47759 RepID=A0A640UMQ4_9ACTN|nr:helix-turn-helix transcriptional regulator [Streptomyces tubercidicus]WAU11664.1 helix-turn-helix domain-containing protein [Streptomyces tubercidicus]GFE36969.1 hypothetical protein Stube_16420 [Streptomyces tubercidicus]